MPLDFNGIWHYTEDDSEATASDLLNLLAASVSTKVAALSLDLLGKEDTVTDPGRVDFGILTAGTQWFINAQNVRIWGPVVELTAQITYQGPAISVPTTGNITNNVAATIAAAYRPGASLPVSVTSTNADPGYYGVFTAWSNGNLRLDRVASAGAATEIPNDSTFNVAGVWLR